MSERTPTLITITVSGGIGSTTIKAGGNCIGIGIMPLTGNPTYTFDVTDCDNFGVFGRSGIVGASTLECWIHFFGVTNLNITSATVDGTYKVKLWYEE